MALEDEIIGLRGDLKAHTAALIAVVSGLNGKAPSPAAASTKAPVATKPPAAAKVPTRTAKEVTEMCIRIKNEISAEAAKTIIAKYGGAEKLVQVKPENFGALYVACEAALEANEAELAQLEAEQNAADSEGDL